MLRWTVCLKDVPTQRYHAAVPVGRKVYFFAEYSNVNYSGQIDVHIFNTVSLRWRKLSPVTDRSGERPVEVPSRRWGHTAVLIRDVIYIWGGSSGFSISYCNVLYAFDVNTHRWLNPEVSGTVPEGRCGHSACVLGTLMYVHGGYNYQMSIFTNDIYKLDTDIMVWSLIDIRGTPPPVTSRHSAAIIGTKMFVFGGYGGQERRRRDQEYYSIRVFDTETNCWLSMPSAQLLPERPYCHSAFTYDGELCIFGGNNETTFTDMWKFNPENLSWKKIALKGKGPDRMRGMHCCIVGDRIIVFGGYLTPHDLYILDLSLSLRSLCKLAVIQYGVTQSELRHDIRLELAAMTDNNNSSGQTN